MLPRGAAGDEGGGWRREYPPGGSRQGALPPVPPGTALAVVLLEAEGCCRGAQPGMRAVGGAGIAIPAEAEKGDTDQHCDRVDALRGGRDPPPSILPPPQRPRRRWSVLGGTPGGTAPGTGGLGRLVCGGLSRRPPRPPRVPATRCRLVRGRRVWPRGAAGDEGEWWRRDCHPGGSRKGGHRSALR